MPLSNGVIFTQQKYDWRILDGKNWGHAPDEVHRPRDSVYSQIVFGHELRLCRRGCWDSRCFFGLNARTSATVPGQIIMCKIIEVLLLKVARNQKQTGGQTHGPAAFIILLQAVVWWLRFTPRVIFPEEMIELSMNALSHARVTMLNGRTMLAGYGTNPNRCGDEPYPIPRRGRGDPANSPRWHDQRSRVSISGSGYRGTESFVSDFQ